jgi:hypothetical protein
MSLKAFHLFFILVSILFCAGLSYWAFKTEASVQLGWGAGLASLCMAGYFVSFLRKYKSIIT